MPRCAASVKCKIEGCRWSARHSADTPHETVEFLDRVRVQHYAEKHPDQPVFQVGEKIELERGDQEATQ